MRRRHIDPRERRIRQIENVVHGLGMKAVAWRGTDYMEVGVEKATRVQCQHCGRVYVPNQGHYIRTHFETQHGLTWKQAWDGYFGGAWREQEYRRQLAAIDEEYKAKMAEIEAQFGEKS